MMRCALTLTTAAFLAGCATVATDPARRIVITPAQAEEWKVGLGAPYWTPSDSLIRRVDRALVRELPSVSEPRPEDGRQGIDGYNIQYLGFTWEGRRLVYANLSCGRVPHADPTKAWFFVSHKGGCFETFVYDPATGWLRG